MERVEYLWESEELREVARYLSEVRLGNVQTENSGELGDEQRRGQDSSLGRG